jgi:malate permease and related proteins
MWQLLTGILWTSLGLLACRKMPPSTPQRLGRLLYWVGVPLQVFALAHKSNFSAAPWLPVLIVFGILILGWAVAALCIMGIRRTGFMPKRSLARRSSRGSFVLSAMLGNTMFIGMAIAPSLIHPDYLGWIVIFGIVHYLMGSYGLGVALANHFGSSNSSKTWLSKLMHLMRVPTLWAFGLGLLAHSIHFWPWIDGVLAFSLKTGVPAVFLLFGMQLGKLRRGRSLNVSVFPALIKMILVPILAGIGLTVLGLPHDARFAMVLMTGMPTNSANLILAEEYHLDSQLAAGSILMSTIALPLMIPLWITLFH